MPAVAVVVGFLVLLALATRKAGATTPEPPTDATRPTTPRVDPRIRARVLDLRDMVARQTYGLRFATVPLVLSVIARESGGGDQYSNAVPRGTNGERGLMQLTLAAFQDYKAEHPDYLLVFEDMEDPESNVQVGAWFLDRKIEEMRARGRANPTYDGLRAYNCGTRGAIEHPTCGGSYAEWVLNVGLPSFTGAVA